MSTFLIILSALNLAFAVLYLTRGEYMAATINISVSLINLMIASYSANAAPLEISTRSVVRTMDVKSEIHNNRIVPLPAIRKRVVVCALCNGYGTNSRRAGEHKCPKCYGLGKYYEQQGNKK